MVNEISTPFYEIKLINLFTTKIFHLSKIGFMEGKGGGQLKTLECHEPLSNALF